MTNNDIKKLCVNLAQAESEQEVVRILKNVGLWDRESVWIDYDHNPNNFSTIGNQQSSPDTALVEKLINSVDAVLTRECLRKGIKPDSENAPQSIAEALKDFFGVYDGKLSSIDASQRVKNQIRVIQLLILVKGRLQNGCRTLFYLSTNRINLKFLLCKASLIWVELGHYNFVASNIIYSSLFRGATLKLSRMMMRQRINGVLL